MAFGKITGWSLHLAYPNIETRATVNGFYCNNSIGIPFDIVVSVIITRGEKAAHGEYRNKS